MSKNRRTRLDQVFRVLLLACVAGVIVSGIAWMRGWEDGFYAVLLFGALANVPMFHFAMNWPLRVTNQSEQAGSGQPAPRPESKSDTGDKPEPELERRSR